MPIAAGKIVTADPNPRHPIDWKALTAVKPNRTEAFLAAGIAVERPGRPADERSGSLESRRSVAEKMGHAISC